MSALSQFANLFSGLKRATQDARKTLADLHEREQQLRRERDALSTQPAAKSDIKAMLSRWIDNSSATYLASLSATLKPFIRRPAEIPQAPSSKNLTLTGAGAIQPLGFGDAIEASDVDQMLLAVFSDHLRSFFDKAVDKIEWPAPEGLPMAERNAKVEALDRQINDLVSEQEKLIAQAAEAGVQLVQVDGYWR